MAKASGAAAENRVMATTATRHRLVTRSDFDGLVCAALLKKLGMLEDILFVHPKDMQDGKIELRPTDITTNLPYVPGVHLAFDHHDSEVERVGAASPENHVIDANARSAARVVYDHFGGDARLRRLALELLLARSTRPTRRDFTQDEILDPTGWILLSFLMDPRTGLGRFRDFRISNYQLMMQLIDACTEMSVDEILAHPDVAERVALYDAHAGQAVQQIRKLLARRGRRRRARPARRGGDPPDEPLHDLRAVPAVPGLGPRPVGPQAAEHRLRRRQVDRRPHVARRRRRAHAPLRRRWPRGRRHLPDRERRGRDDAAELVPARRGACARRY